MFRYHTILVLINIDNMANKQQNTNINFSNYNCKKICIKSQICHISSTFLSKSFGFQWQIKFRTWSAKAYFLDIFSHLTWTLLTPPQCLQLIKFCNRVRNRKIFLFLNQTICCGYSKEQSWWDGSFEHPKHILKIMGKKYLQFYAVIFCYLNLW